MVTRFVLQIFQSSIDTFKHDSERFGHQICSVIYSIVLTIDLFYICISSMVRERCDGLSSLLDGGNLNNLPFGMRREERREN